MTDGLFDRQLDAGPSANPPAAWEGWAMIEVRRRAEWTRGLVAWTVIVDGLPIGYVDPARPISHRVRTGWHSVSVSMQSLSSQDERIFVASGGRATLLCGTNAPRRRKSIARAVLCFLLAGPASGLAFCGVAAVFPAILRHEAIVAWMVMAFLAIFTVPFVLELRRMMPGRSAGETIVLAQIAESGEAWGKPPQSSTPAGRTP